MRSVPNPTAQKYRDEAWRLRGEALQMKDPEHRRQLLEIAEQYEKLGADLDRLGSS
jgi:hypothetical protein